MSTAPLPARYRIIEEVGQGGMAVVYRACDEKLRREVAVKVLHAHLLAEPESKARLEREARAVAKLNHDGILQIFGVVLLITLMAAPLGGLMPSIRAGLQPQNTPRWRP